MIRGIHHVQLTIPNGAEEEVRRLYCRVLGLPEIQIPTSLTGRGGLWLQVGDHHVHSGVEDGVNRYATKAHIAYEVSNLQVWKRNIATLGIEIMENRPLALKKIGPRSCVPPDGKRWNKNTSSDQCKVGTRFGG